MYSGTPYNLLLVRGSLTGGYKHNRKIQEVVACERFQL